jgi:hypothetical protein
MTKTLTTKPINTLEELPTLKTSAEFGIAIKRLQNELSAAQEQKTAFAKDLDLALFTGGDINKVRAQIHQAENLIANLEAAITGAEKRRDAIAAVEFDDETAELAGANKTDAEALTKTYGEIADCLELLRAKFASADKLHWIIDGRNNELETRKRPDLKTNLSKVKRLALLNDKGERAATPPRYDLSRDAMDMDVFLRDLSINRNVKLPLHMSGLRTGAIETNG